MFQPPIAAASLSGDSNAEWARRAAPQVGCAFLGGVAIDATTRQAAEAMVDRGRTEFLPQDPIAFVGRQLSALEEVDVRPGCNVRSATPEPVADVAAVCADYDAIVEINAHCRQDEMCATGAGESLLHDDDRLCEQVEAAAETGATVSVKVRTEVEDVHLPAVSARIVAAGGDAVHVDAMDSEHVVGEVVAAAPDAFVIANNGVRDRPSVREYLEYGADAVSVGRPSDDPTVLSRVREAVAEWFDTERPRPDADSGVSPDA